MSSTQAISALPCISHTILLCTPESPLRHCGRLFKLLLALRLVLFCSASSLSRSFSVFWFALATDLFSHFLLKNILESLLNSMLIFAAAFLPPCCVSRL
jgi:hypothetical protein